MENTFTMFSDNLLGIAISNRPISLIDIKEHKYVKNYIDPKTIITSIIRPQDFQNYEFLCGLYCYDCHGGNTIILQKVNY